MRKLVRSLTVVVIFAGTSVAASVSAASATANFETIWDLKWFGQFDYVCGCYEDHSSLPDSMVVAKFPAYVHSSIDYGLSTITHLGYLGDTDILLRLLDRVGNDPIGNGLSDLGKQAYTFPNVSDYATFVEQFAFQDNIYS